MKDKQTETHTYKVDTKNNNQQDKKSIENKNDEALNEKKFINILNISINGVLSIFLLFLTYCVFNNYEKKYVITFFLTFWSFFMNLFYILSITILDLIKLFKRKTFFKYCFKFNDFVRNSYLRICFPFSLSIVFLYWMLILLGDQFQYASRSLWDNCISFSFHGLIFIFLLYDTLSYPHINKKNRKMFDFLLISGLIIVYFVVLGIAKYVLFYEPYDFMTMSNVRQIAAAAILIYIGIMDGYIIFVLIANRFFIQEKEEKSIEDNKIDVKTLLKIINSDNGEQKEKYIHENFKNKNVLMQILDCPKSSNRIKLKPINLKKIRKNGTQKKN